MAELEGRTTRLAVLLGVSVIVIGVAAAVPHRANEIGAVAIGIGLFTICWLKGKRGFALLGLVIPFVWLTGAIRLVEYQATLAVLMSRFRRGLSVLRLRQWM